MAQKPNRPRSLFREVSPGEAADAADVIYDVVARHAHHRLSQLPDDYAGIVDFVESHCRSMPVKVINAALLLSEFLRYRAHQAVVAAELRQYRLMCRAKDGVYDLADIGAVLGLTKQGTQSRLRRLAAADRGDGTVRTVAALQQARARDADAAAAAAAGAEELRQAATWIVAHPDRFTGDEDFDDDVAELAGVVAGWPLDDGDTVVERAQKLRVLLRPLVKGIGPAGEGAVVPAQGNDADAVGVLRLARSLV